MQDKNKSLFYTINNLPKTNGVYLYYNKKAEVISNDAKRLRDIDV